MRRTTRPHRTLRRIAPYASARAQESPSSAVAVAPDRLGSDRHRGHVRTGQLPHGGQSRRDDGEPSVRARLVVLEELHDRFLLLHRFRRGPQRRSSFGWRSVDLISAFGGRDGREGNGPWRRLAQLYLSRTRPWARSLSFTLLSCFQRYQPEARRTGTEERSIRDAKLRRSMRRKRRRLEFARRAVELIDLVQVTAHRVRLIVAPPHCQKFRSVCQR